MYVCTSNLYLYIYIYLNICMYAHNKLHAQQEKSANKFALVCPHPIPITNMQTQNLLLLVSSTPFDQVAL